MVRPKVVSMEADLISPERLFGYTSRPGNWDRTVSGTCNNCFMEHLSLYGGKCTGGCSHLDIGSS